ncbi:hypothetical protein D3C81_1765670 [compost metagenome]
MQFTESLANHLFGKAGAFAALGPDPGAFANFAITAAALFIDGVADLGIGNTLAEADVHKADYWDQLRLRRY